MVVFHSYVKLPEGISSPVKNPTGSFKGQSQLGNVTNSEAWPGNIQLVGGLEDVLFSIINIWDNPSHWLIFFRGVETTNQTINPDLSRFRINIMYRL